MIKLPSSLFLFLSCLQILANIIAFVSYYIVQLTLQNKMSSHLGNEGADNCEKKDALRKELLLGAEGEMDGGSVAKGGQTVLDERYRGWEGAAAESLLVGGAGDDIPEGYVDQLLQKVVHLSRPLDYTEKKGSSGPNVCYCCL